MIVLDTHAWIWWLSDPRQLGRLARRRIEAATRIGIPAICCLEVATLAARGRVVLDRPTLHWLNDALAEPGVELLDLTPAVAVKAAELAADLPGDPANRLIAASAILQSAPLVTRDARLRKFAGVRTVWT